MTARVPGERPPRPAPAPRPPGFEHGGVLLIDKPQQHTSFDVVARVRRRLGLRRVGHAGTLDPMATGVLVVAYDWATRLIEYLTADTKRYVAVARLGITTSTDDAEGSPLRVRPVPIEWSDQLGALRQRFSGNQRQRPPAYSAIHVDGVRAHKLARAGNDLQLPEREVEVLHLSLERVDDLHVAIEVEVSAGTYVRSLARDLGEALGCGAHLVSLRRVASGHLELGQCVALDVFESLADPLRGPWSLTPWEATAQLATLEASEDQVRELRFGRSIPVSTPQTGVVRAGSCGELVALCEATGDGTHLHPFRVVPVTGAREESEDGP